MRNPLTAVLSRLVVVVALALTGVGLAVVSAAPPASAGTLDCGLPAGRPTSGQLQLDRSSVRPGERTIGIVSDLRTWPIRLIGGGSGETFESCVPWAPGIRTEVMVHDNAGYFVVSVPATVRAGTYQIGLVFAEGGTPLTGGTLVRFNVPLTVTASPAPITGSTKACQQSHRSATVGTLQSGGGFIGRTLGAQIIAGDPLQVGGLNEYDRLAYIACLAGQAYPVTGLASSTSQFSLPVPADLQPGNHSLVVFGWTAAPGGIATWRATVLIEAAPTLQLSPDPAPAGSWLSVSGSCDHTTSISLISRAFDRNNGHNWDNLNGVWQFSGQGSAGTFSGRILLRNDISGDFGVGMRCGGGLAASTTLTVSPSLSATGSAVAPELATGGASVLAGAGLLILARRRSARR